MPLERRKRAILIAGPTASGKSALAMRLAAERDGVIINVDAMQVYSTLRVLTARPSTADEMAVPHRLFGFVDPSLRFSTGGWLRAVADVIASAEPEDRPLIFTGGTGLYFDALMGGFADVPPIPDAVVKSIESEVRALDEAGRCALIAARDPVLAARLTVPDPQRVTRALSVLAHTGRSLTSFQDVGAEGLLAGYQVERLLVDPGRDIVRQRIAYRFNTMLQTGAEDEVRALLSRNLSPDLPAMKAIGVPEIGAWLRGQSSRTEAIELAIIATHQYAKRQRTWFRNRFSDWTPTTSP